MKAQIREKTAVKKLKTRDSKIFSAVNSLAQYELSTIGSQLAQKAKTMKKLALV